LFAPFTFLPFLTSTSYLIQDFKRAFDLTV
jgi:hypothetical protein